MQSLHWRRNSGSSASSSTGTEVQSFSESETIAKKHTKQAFSCALEMITKLNKDIDDGSLLVRIGCSTGTILGGIISRYKFAYDIFGSAVDSAELLSSVGGPLSFSLCEETLTLIKEDVDSFLYANPDFKLTPGSFSETESTKYVTISPKT